MNFTIKIRKEDDVPVYRQIIEQITKKIQKGELKAGDKLPPEREFAKSIEVARGTIKKAYEKLAENKILEIVQGRGTFVSSEQDILGEGRKNKAIRTIGNMLTELEKLKFRPREIKSLFQIMLMEHEQRRQSIYIAGIDCNPEALSIFDLQLRHISNVRLFRFLLDDLYTQENINQKLKEFDLILTTATHYAEIIGVMPEFKEKIVQIVVSPSQQTIIELAQIPASAKIGVITSSLNFLNIIKSKLRDFQISTKNVKHLFENEPNKFSKFIAECDIIITPPKCQLENNSELKSSFQHFSNNAGKIIRFNYQIERSALIHIEEKISELIQRRQND